MIYFNEDKHTYTNTETDEKYISVTTLLGKYKTLFDKDKHSRRVAQREGIPQDMVLEMWRSENKKSTDRGTKIHKVMEKYITDGERGEGVLELLYSSYNDTISSSVDRFSNVYSEILLYNNSFKIAGTADLIYDHGEYFTIGDFKTNKRFNYSSNYNEHFKDPINHLQYCEHNNYALQMSMYAYMYEQMSNKKCKKIFVLYLENDKWVPIYCNYLKSDIKNILSHYKQSNFETLDLKA